MGQDAFSLMAASGDLGSRLFFVSSPDSTDRCHDTAAQDETEIISSLPCRLVSEWLVFVIHHKRSHALASAQRTNPGNRLSVSQGIDV
jgi:hypothetical protein